ncbi:antirestriction protein ArdA [Caulobacter sp. LARHSG274]
MERDKDPLNPRIYVACLAAYNQGELHGAWIDVDDDADAVREAISAMLAASPVAGAEEYAIHDEEDFGAVEIAEYASIDRVVEIAVFLRERGKLGGLVLNHLDGDVGAAERALDEQYHGVFERLFDYCQELTEETVAVPQVLQYYIDYEAMARDAEMSGDIFTIQTARDEIHVFGAR